ncbi:type II toxin-antitoxin system RelE/ParE family toxin [Methylogaea oryzae]|uniref:Toxin, RelE family protein n=1 Tax=Methylogaea oryzae TaxID=1295382 RepID=A0A8D5AJP1_9GAMM|nr:type II toxin-antitoxin system RelE/ParE family toxin [Methylogaea oryzae]BBL70261.1 toxin, RelE family protein [Methylogaea oryzae]
MINRLIIRPEAEADLADAQAWYEAQRKGLAAEFLLSVEEALERIGRIPSMYSATYRDIRRVLLRRFPYVIYYRIVRDDVVIVAVLHTARNPRLWKSRTPKG